MSKGWKYGLGMGVLIVLLFIVNLLVGSVFLPAKYSVSFREARPGKQAGASSCGNRVYLRHLQPCCAEERWRYAD